MNEIIFLVEDSQDGGYSAKALNYSIFTDADDISSLRKNIQDAILCHFEENQHPKVVRLHFVREETFGIAV